MAGWGRYPILVAETLRKQGYELYCQGVVGHADPRLADICDKFAWVGLGQVGQAIRFFQRHGVSEATMVGKIHKVLLFQPWRWLTHFPDLATFRTFAPHFLTKSRSCTDDSLLVALVNMFAAAGIRFAPATDYVPRLLIREGQLTRLEPSASQWKDIRFGWEIAKEMGRLDIGQSVIVKDQAVMAVEAIEGTDQCILRAGDLCRSGGFTVTKVAKPQQDMRFDVPTVGVKTLKNMVAAGGKVLAVEADKTIILDEPDVIKFANQNRLVIVAIHETHLSAA
jgi:DUF1009 family protein